MASSLPCKASDGEICVRQADWQESLPMGVYGGGVWLICPWGVDSVTGLRNFSAPYRGLKAVGWASPGGYNCERKQEKTRFQNKKNPSAGNKNVHGDLDTACSVWCLLS